MRVQNKSLRHIDYFRLNALENQQMQEDNSAFTFLKAGNMSSALPTLEGK
jgi:hypothetical protein